MPLPVNLQDVVDELQMASDQLTSYINRKTGELITISEENASLAEEPEPPEDLPDWQAETLSKVREVLDNKDFLPLPDEFEIDEWSIMRRFASSQPDPTHRDDLLGAIHGRGAFRLFKILLDRLNLSDEWFRFRDESLEQIAIDFFDSHEIPYVRAKPRPR